MGYFQPDIEHMLPQRDKDIGHNAPTQNKHSVKSNMVQHHHPGASSGARSVLLGPKPGHVDTIRSHLLASQDLVYGSVIPDRNGWHTTS